MRRFSNRSLNKTGLGRADDAVVVDMVNFNKREINSEDSVAVFGSGLLLKDVARFLHQNGGRYFPHGASPTVGIGGHILVGGMGYLSRKNGLSIDALREIEVVLADGTVTRASADKNPDLFWAM
jgi:FAD/FMN-containing dehydrogenase